MERTTRFTLAVYEEVLWTLQKEQELGVFMSDRKSAATFLHRQQADEDTSQLSPSSGNGQTGRLFRLLQLLMLNECTRKDVFERLAPHYKIEPAAPDAQDSMRKADRMFERDIAFLKEQGFKINKVKAYAQPTRYSLVKGSGPRVPLLFTPSEVDGLALLYNIFADPTKYTQADPMQPLPVQASGNPFAKEILSFIEKLVATLPPEQKAQFDRWVHKPFVYFNLSTVANYLPCRATIDSIVQAISNRRQIQFEYISMRSQQDVTFHEHIDPYYITYMEGHFYLIAYSHEVNRFLEYRLDRIRTKSLKPEPDTVKTVPRRRPIEFRFWIDGDIAKRGVSQRWLTQVEEREEAYLDEQGKEHRRVLIRATTYNEWRVIPQILKYGEKAKLVEPAHLREQMKDVVKRMHNFYKD